MLIFDASWKLIEWLLTGMLTTIFSGAGFVMMTFAIEYAKLCHRKKASKSKILREFLNNPRQWTSRHNTLLNQLSKRKSSLSTGSNLFDAYKTSNVFLGNAVPKPTRGQGVQTDQGSPLSSVDSFELNELEDQERRLDTRFGAKTPDSSKKGLCSDKVLNDPRQSVLSQSKAFSHRLNQWLACRNSLWSKPVSVRHRGQRYQNDAMRSDYTKLWSTNTELHSGRKPREKGEVASWRQRFEERKIQCSNLRPFLSSNMFIQVTNNPSTSSLSQTRKVFLGDSGSLVQQSTDLREKQTGRFHSATQHFLLSRSNDPNSNHDDHPTMKAESSSFKLQAGKKNPESQVLLITKNIRSDESRTKTATAISQADTTDVNEKVAGKVKTKGRFGMMASLMPSDHIVDKQFCELMFDNDKDASDKKKEKVPNVRSFTRGASTTCPSSTKSVMTPEEVSQIKKCNSLRTIVKRKDVGRHKTNPSFERFNSAERRKRSKQRIQNECSPNLRTPEVHETKNSSKEETKNSSLELTGISHGPNQEDKSEIFVVGRECSVFDDDVIQSNQTKDSKNSVQELYEHEHTFGTQISGDQEVMHDIKNNIFSSIHRAGARSILQGQNSIATGRKSNPKISPDIEDSPSYSHLKNRASVDDLAKGTSHKLRKKLCSHDFTSKEVILTKTSCSYRSTISKQTKISLGHQRDTMMFKTMESTTNFREKVDHQENEKQRFGAFKKLSKEKKVFSAATDNNSKIKGLGLTVAIKKKKGEENSGKILKSSRLHKASKEGNYSSKVVVESKDANSPKGKKQHSKSAQRKILENVPNTQSDARFPMRQRGKTTDLKRQVKLLSEESTPKPKDKPLKLKPRGSAKQVKNNGEQSSIQEIRPEKQKSSMTRKKDKMNKSTDCQNTLEISPLVISKDCNRKIDTLPEKTGTQKRINMGNNQDDEGSQFLLRKSCLDEVVQRLQCKDPQLMSSPVVDSSRFGEGEVTSPLVGNIQNNLPCKDAMLPPDTLPIVSPVQGSGGDGAKKLSTKIFGESLVPLFTGSAETGSKTSGDGNILLQDQKHSEGMGTVKAEEIPEGEQMFQSNENLNKTEEPFAVSSSFTNNSHLTFQGLGSFKFPNAGNLFTSKAFEKYRDQIDSDNDV